MDMRAGTETALARVVAVFGAAKPHHAYLVANRRANRIKVLVHDGEASGSQLVDCIRVDFTGLVFATVQSLNWMLNNFRH